MQLMKRISKLYIICLGAVLMLAASCTHNDGNIGKQFGLWKLTELKGVDNNGHETTYPDDSRDVSWAFQNTTVEMMRVDRYHNETRTYGNYRLEDNTLFLNFPDADMAPLSGMRLPAQCELAVIRLTGSEMILSYSPSPAPSDPSEPATYYYYFKKL